MSLPLMFALKDVVLKESAPKELLVKKHSSFIKSYEQRKDDYEYVVSESLRLSGVFWCLSALDLIGDLEVINRDDVIAFVFQCRHENGGFGASDGHDPHILHTLSAIQILIMYGCLDLLDVDQTVQYIGSLQQPDGSFAGDEWGRPEKLPDVCYSWWVLASLAIIGRQSWIDKNCLRRFILACQEEEQGGIADRPGDEPDPFHTLFGLAGLSLLGEECLEKVNPVFCMPEKRLSARCNIQTLKL